jgi:putative transposase
MPAVGPPQRQCLVLLFSTILALRGRVNVRHLSRYWDDSERPLARQCRRAFDWPDFPQRVITTALDPPAEVRSAPAASCIAKSGHQTFGLGHGLNSCAGRAERGLEISTRAVVEVTHRGAFTRAVAPTPPPCATATQQDQDATLVDVYRPQLRAPHHRLPAWVTSPAGDGDWAKTKDPDAGVDLRRHPIPKLRGEAAGRFLCTGPQPTRRRAHRTDDGKVHWQDLSRFAALGTLAEAEPGQRDPAVVWHVTRKRKRRVVVLRNRQAPATPRALVFAATALAVDGHQRLEWYGARFPREFLCRDSQQCTGLTACQARTEAALSLHGNASRATLHLVRAEDLNAPSGAEPRVVSMASWKPCPGHERWLELCREK